MRLISGLSLPQRIVLVVALAAACVALGGYLNSLGTTAAFGWYAYAPLSSTARYPFAGFSLPHWGRLLIWLGLTALWALVSLWLLRPARPAAPAS